jgi:Protein of unknown function (DUF2911)
MKKITIAFAILLFSAGITAQVKMPAPSPTQTIKQDFALGYIEVKYSRPIAKGRKVFGDLVPLNKLWRTGANEATIIKFSDPVEIKGKKIDSGTYAIYSIPGIESWEIILNRGVNNWGIDGYKESEDVARFNIEPVKLSGKNESLTMQFAEVKASTCQLQISWEKTSISIPISASINERIRSQIEAGLKTDNKPYWQAAQFYNEYDKNPAKALDYVSKAVEQYPNAFWIWLYKARIEKEAGNKTAALASSKKSLDLAREAKNDDYIKMNLDLQKTLN